MLVGRDGMKISTCSALSRTLQRPGNPGPAGLPLDQVIIVAEGNEPRGVWVPWALWFQIQHFVSRVIERDS